MQDTPESKKQEEAKPRERKLPPRMERDIRVKSEEKQKKKLLRHFKKVNRCKRQQEAGLEGLGEGLGGGGSVLWIGIVEFGLVDDHAVSAKAEGVDLDEACGIALVVASGDIHRREFTVVEGAWGLASGPDEIALVEFKANAAIDQLLGLGKGGS